MSKAIIVTDFAYKSPKRTGRGTGAQGLKATLAYLQYRDTRNNDLAKNRRYERWQDRGLGKHYREIFQTCAALQSPHVLAWTWVISPAPDVMALVPERDRRDLLTELTDRIVQDYYAARGLETPEYAFVLHERLTEPERGQPPMQHLHAHVILPGTAPLQGVDRAPMYNNASKGHDKLFRDLGSEHFADLLQERGIEWQRLRETTLERSDRGNDFFGR